MTEILLLCAGLVAGAVNALAGGGSFIAFPALLAAGVPPVMANASNTYAALPGYLSGAVGFWSDIVKYKEKLLVYCLVALGGGYLGAELLLKVSNEQFSLIVPWLMAISVIAFAFGGRFSRWVAARHGGSRRMALAGAAGLLGLLGSICLYGGFFNAGLGIMLLAFFALAGMTDIHAMNGLKLLISTLVAVIAVLRFGLGGSIAWYEGSIVFAGTLIGGYGAARAAHLVPTPVLRRAIIAYGTVLTAYFFYGAYA